MAAWNSIATHKKEAFFFLSSNIYHVCGRCARAPIKSQVGVRILAHCSPDRQILSEGRKTSPEGNRHPQFLFSKRTKVLQAVAVPIVPTSADSAEYRNQLAEIYGFKQIGEPLPENIKLKDIIDTLPKKAISEPNIVMSK
ncbi:hypothetical protein FH972_020833 [Carpinus fangiana]|uniref:Uncharacterized protein n=1 Tax=Carpinus fangiana TaxID=176857 RepID=A0A5N6RW03_9ROSI|nr:hypothetical protein FH972_020833 [Carpinus fangiana]